MKAVFNCRKKIGTLEQDYLSGCVEWPVERPGLSLRTEPKADPHVSPKTLPARQGRSDGGYRYIYPQNQ